MRSAPRARPAHGPAGGALVLVLAIVLAGWVAPAARADRTVGTYTPGTTPSRSAMVLAYGDSLGMEQTFVAPAGATGLRAVRFLLATNQVAGRTATLVRLGADDREAGPALATAPLPGDAFLGSEVAFALDDVVPAAAGDRFAIRVGASATTDRSDVFGFAIVRPKQYDEGRLRERTPSGGFAYGTSLGSDAYFAATFTGPDAPRSDLADLRLRDLGLEPTFDPLRTRYLGSAALPWSRDTIGVTPTAADPAATVVVDDTPVARGATVLVRVPVGESTFSTVVTAPDGTSRTTTVALRRDAGRTVAVRTEGSGTGTVRSTPGGLVCTTGDPAPCSVTHDRGALVSLDAQAAPGSRFVGFGGDCATATRSVCGLSLTEDRTATARFERLPVEPAVPPGAGPATAVPAPVEPPRDVPSSILAPPLPPAPAPTAAPGALVRLDRPASRGRGRSIAVVAHVDRPGTVEAVATIPGIRPTSRATGRVLVAGRGRDVLARLATTRIRRAGSRLLVLPRTTLGRRARFGRARVPVRVVVLFTPATGDRVRAVRSTVLRLAP